MSSKSAIGGYDTHSEEGEKNKAAQEKDQLPHGHDPGINDMGTVLVEGYRTSLSLRVAHRTLEVNLIHICRNPQRIPWTAFFSTCPDDLQEIIA